MADTETGQESPTTFYTRVHGTDNVAIIVNDSGLKTRARFLDRPELIEHTPQGRKVTLLDIPIYGEIVRYGEVIGCAVRDTPRGSWTDESMIELPRAPPSGTPSLAAKVPEPLPPLEGYTLKGYRDADSSVDTKNLLGISASVHYVAGVVGYVVKIIERDLLPKYPNVDGVAGSNHLYDCGVVISAPAATAPIHAIHNIVLNPDFSGEVAVTGLGCEKLQPERLLEGTHDVKDVPINNVSTVSLQDEKRVSFQSIIIDILQVAEHHLAKLNQYQRETCPASELVVGMQCGGNDAFSGMTANPAVGYTSDLLVRCGATVIFSEVAGVRDAIRLLAPRAINEEVGKHLLGEMAWYDNYPDMGKTDRGANPSPGSKEGGLASVVEKALGLVAKPGKNTTVGILSPGQRPTRRGLIYAVVPASDLVCSTQQVASGITVQVLTTGYDIPYGLMTVSVIKMAARIELANRWSGLMDINADIIATGEEAIGDVGPKLFEFILDAASGHKKISSDQQGLHSQPAVFDPVSVT